MQARPVVYNKVMDGLKRAPHLRIITIPCKLSGDSMLRTLAENRRLKEIRLIQVPSPSRDWPMDYRAQYGQLEPRVRDLIVFEPESLSFDPTDRSTNLLSIGFPNTSPSNPRFVPMEQVDDNVRDTIWDCILRFALEVDIYKGGGGHMHPRLLDQLAHTRASVPRVCKDFQVIHIIVLALELTSMSPETLPSLHLWLSNLSEPTKHGRIRKESTA
jgi:hypothetical protein